MANVKVPPLLHKRSKTSQIAWYKANKMPLPSHLTGGGGYSAAQAKKDVGELNKQKAKEKAAAAKPVDRMELIKKAAEKRAGRTQVAKLRAAFGGEVPGARYDDPLAMARAGMPIRGYRLGEAAKPDASMAMTNQLKNKMISNKDKQTLGKIADLMAAAKNKDKKNEYVRQLGLKAMKKGEVDPARGHSPTRFGREVLNKEEVEKKEEPPFTPDKKKVRRGTGGPMSQAKWLAKQAMMKKMKELQKEEVEQIDELKKSTLASYVKKSAADIGDRAVQVGMSHGLRDAGVLDDEDDDGGEEDKNRAKVAKRTKGIERASDKLAKEEVEQVDEGKGYSPGWMLRHPDGVKLAKKIKVKKELEKNRQKAYGNPNAGISVKKEEIEQVVEQDDSMEKKEMAQTQLHFIGYAAKEILEFIDMGGEIEEWYQNKLSKVQSEVESLHSYIEGEKRRTGMVKEEEQIDEKAPPGAKYERMVKHIKKGYAKDGLTPKEKSIAYATAWKAYGKKEEVEQIDEVGDTAKGRAALGSYVKKKHDQFYHNRMMAKTQSDLDRIRKDANKNLARAEKRLDPKGPFANSKFIKSEEVVTEAEGTVAVTPKEKALAAHHGDPKKITYGDVVKARIKSAAEKAMKKGN